MNFVDGGRIGLSEIKTIGVRPEHVQLSRQDGSFLAIIVYVEHLGADTVVISTAKSLVQLRPRLFGEDPCRPDEKIIASFDGDRAHHFDSLDNAIR